MNSRIKGEHIVHRHWPMINSIEMQICSETKLDSVMTYNEIEAKFRYSLETLESVSGKRELF